MTTFLLRRLLLALVLVAVSVTLGFFVLHIIPGDPLGMVVEQAGRSAQVLSELRARYGLDQPLTSQYASFVTRTFSGDFGTSLVDGQPVLVTVRAALGNSLLLATSGLTLAALVGMSVGSLQGWQPRSLVGRVLGAVLTALYAAPAFIVAIAFITLLAYRWALFPIGGVSDPVLAIVGTRAEQLRDALWHLALPSLTLAMGWGAAVARQQRISLVGIAGENHVRSARAKGVRERSVFGQHAFRPSLPAVIVVMGLMLPELVGGGVIVETLFAWPGIGSLLLKSIAARDYPMVSAAIVTVGIVVSVAGLLTDTLIAAIDPRVRAQVL